VFIDDS